MLRIKRISRKNQSGGKKPKEDSCMELTIPTHFRCPISLDLMKDPVTLRTGITYDRQSIEAWLDAGNRTCPVTNQVLKSFEQIPNHTIRVMIQDWCVKNRSYGIERIPTPRVPLTEMEVSDILAQISTKSRCLDHGGCYKLVKNINVLAKESERNRRCAVSSGSNRTLSAAFSTFASASPEKYTSVLEEILSAMVALHPLDDETQLNLTLPESLNCLVWFLKRGSLAGRKSAVLAMKELVSSDRTHLEALVGTEGLIEAVVKVIKEPICPTTTKASLTVIFYMVSSSSSKEMIAKRTVEMGLVSLLLEMLVESDKSGSEKALGVLDGIFSCEDGRQEAYYHALTMPVLVKKIFRVSELATEFAVSAIWKLCKNYKGEDGGIMLEALMVGIFQKFLLLLQVGCGEKTKEKATYLLKLFNVYRRKLECIDSMDFKHLKRPF